MIKIRFDTQKQLNALRTPLGNISFANDAGVILYFDKDTIKAYPQAQSKNLAAHISIS